MIGRVEALECEFGDCDVDRRAEYRHRAEQRNDAVLGLELERQHDVGSGPVIGRVPSAAAWRRVVFEFTHQFD